MPIQNQIFINFIPVEDINLNNLRMAYGVVGFRLIFNLISSQPASTPNGIVVNTTTLPS
jgi:hypothetical protein